MTAVGTRQERLSGNSLPDRHGRHGKREIGPTRDPVSDTGPIGLFMFNLGSIPASVTPPRSWRRATWFTVVAGIAVLAGLLTVGTVLVGPIQPTGRIDSAPYFPGGTPLAAIGGPDSDRDTGTDAPRSTPGASPIRLVTNTDTVVRVSVPTATIPANPATSSPAGPPRPANALPTFGTLPVITTLTSPGDPVVDPAKLIKRTRTFFAEVTTNAQAAAALTSGTAAGDTTAIIHRKYGGISTIQVRSISLDPTSGLTVCVLRVVDKDGTTQTQQARLQFTLTDDPKITNPGG